MRQPSPPKPLLIALIGCEAFLLLLSSGVSTDTPEVSAEGITGRVMLILTDVIGFLVWVILVAVCAHECFHGGMCTSIVDCDLLLARYSNLYCKVLIPV